MEGVGSKSYWKIIWERLAGDGTASITNVEDMEKQETEDIDEMGVYREIKEKIGVAIPRLRYKPEGMKIKEYVIDENQRKVYLFYKYGDEIVRYTVYMNDTDSSFGQKDTDTLGEEDIIQVNNINIYVKEYDIDSDNSIDKRFVAEFQYRDVQYQLKAIMEKKEFDKILENLYFL